MAEFDRAEVSAADAEGQVSRRIWKTPRVIVSEASRAQHNTLVAVNDHTAGTGSSSGTQNS